MNDIKTQPYSQWLEACLRILVDLQPEEMRRIAHKVMDGRTAETAEEYGDDMTTIMMSER